MKAHILAALSSVRLRRRLQSALSFGTAGLLGSGLACLLLGIVRLFTRESLPPSTIAGILLAGPAIGGVLGFLWTQPWHRSASAVDTHYGLKDRTVTALEFADSAESSPFHDLQLQDATRHLASVNARQVAPLRIPRQTPAVALTLLLSAALLLYPVAPRVHAHSAQPIGIQLAADQIAADLEDLDDFAEQEQIAELQELVEELRQELEELKDPQTDVREALATISEMQARLAAEQAQYNDAVVDAQLQSVGAALAAAEAFQSAAAELQEGDFEKAAEELEKLEDVQLDRRESRTTSEKLAKAAAAMQSAGQGQLSDAVSQMSEAVKSQDSDKICQSCDKLAKNVRRHSLSKSVNALLQAKLNKLSECKSLCNKVGTCSKCGGLCQSESQCMGMSLAQGFNPARSNSPSKSAGAASAGNIDGEMTSLNANRNLAEITGQLSGEGESEFETSTSPEGREAARRQARESFAKYQKMSEAVLESEPIPLGHRQTIRRYFELIRPGVDEGFSEAESTSP